MDDLFFTAPPNSSATVPDIPEATVTTVQESGSLYFTVDSERGVYRSASNITSKACHMQVTCPHGDVISMLRFLITFPHIKGKYFGNSCQTVCNHTLEVVAEVVDVVVDVWANMEWSHVCLRL